MDVILHARNAGKTPEQAAEYVPYEAEQIARVYQDIDQKRATTRYLHLPALLIEPVEEIK